MVLVPFCAHYFSAFIGKEISLKYGADTEVYSYNIIDNYSLDFYARRIVPVFETPKLLNAREIIIFTNSAGFKKLQSMEYNIYVLKELDSFHVTGLIFDFLRPSLRPNAVGKNYLLSITQ